MIKPKAKGLGRGLEALLGGDEPPRTAGTEPRGPVTALPVAFFSTALTKSRATGSDTSASSSATRTSRSAVVTSASVRAPCLVSRSKTPPSRSERDSNIAPILR